MTRSELRQLIRETIEEISKNTPKVKTVVDMKTKKVVGYFQYGKGFVPSEVGKSMGYTANKTIPNFTKMEDQE